MERWLRRGVVVLLAIVLVPAVAYGTLSALRWLGLGLRMESDESKAEYLIGAAQHAHRGEVDRVLRLGIVPATAADDESYTALMGAAFGGDAAIVRMLLERGAAVNARTEPSAKRSGAGVSALMIAAQKGHLEAAQLLLERGADPNLQALPLRADGRDFAGETALSLAVEAGNPPMVELLLARGARWDLPRTVDGTPYLPLTLALGRGRVDIAERLAAAGASVDAIVTSGPAVGCTQLMLLAGFAPEPAPEGVRWAAARSSALDRYGDPPGPCAKTSAMMRAEAHRNWRTALALLRAGAFPYPPGVPRATFDATERERYAAALERHAQAR